MAPSLRFGLGAAGAALYAIVSARLMATQPESAGAILVVLGPMAAVALLALWRGSPRWLALLVTLLAAGLLFESLPLAGWSPRALYLGQHVGVHLALAAWFGASLRPGRVPMITRFAAQLHVLTPAKVVYTRQVTIAWVAYFVVMALVSLALFAGAPFAAWSVFANLLTPIGLVAMFAVEYAVRYRLHPEFERIDMATAWRAYRDHREPPTR